MSIRLQSLAVSAAAVALVLAPSAILAQGAPVRVSEQLRHKDRLATVQLPANTVAAELSVAPVAERAIRARPAVARRAAGDLEAPPAPPAPPDPIEPETMNLLGRALGGEGFGGGAAGDFQAPGPPVLDHIELSARVPWVNEKGYLQSVLAYSSPAGPSIRFDRRYPGWLTVKLKVEKGRTYLVDFAVRSWGTGSYRVETAGGAQEFADDQGNLAHVLVALNATESGWVDVRFNRAGAGYYYLYSVKVDRME